jgi:hypothetical protein
MCILSKILHESYFFKCNWSRNKNINEGFESINLTFLIFCIIGIFKDTRSTFASDTCFDIIKFEINCNFILNEFCKPNCFAFFISKLMFHVVHTSLCILKDKMTNKKM